MDSENIDLDSTRRDDIDEDIYAFFNLKKDAKKDDINNAYRRLSIIYHPDKHSDPKLKVRAERMFNKINAYYNILSDDQKRHMYDLNICRSLADLNRMQISPLVDPITGQPLSANQIKLEYQRLVEEAERKEFMEKTNPQGTITVTVSACDLFRPRAEVGYYIDDILMWQSDQNSWPELSSLEIGQSVECPCSSKDRLVIGGNLVAENGIGSGNLTLLWRHIFDQSTWTHASLTAGDNPNIGFKLYGPIFRKFFTYGFGHLTFNFVDRGFLQPDVLVGAYKQLDKHWVGSISTGITCNFGNLVALQNITPMGYVTTSLTYDDQFCKKISFSLRVGQSFSYLGLSSIYRFRDENDSNLKLILKLGTMGLISQLGFERKVSEHSSFGCLCKVQIPQGKLSLRLRWQRANQNYVLNLLVCDEYLYPKAIVYTLIAPTVLYTLAMWCFKQYWERRGQRLRNEELEKEKTESEIKKKDAQITVQLMMPYADRVKDQEEQIGGLVILEAKYGASQSINEDETGQLIIDVTVPLQAMVKNSKLILQKSSKAHLAGFYDPCIGKDKILQIIYQFNNGSYQIAVNDEEDVILPHQDHKVQDSGANFTDTSGFFDDTATRRAGEESFYED